MSLGEQEFAALCEPYRRQLRAHCYRMMGSFDDAEDLVQETFLRAWRGREGFEGRALLRTWLYRIATNACLSALERAPRRVLPPDVVPAVTPTTEPRAQPPWAPEVPWMQPYPDELLDPEERLAARETVQLAFLAALQHLPPRQRAALILCDVVGFSAAEAADLLETSLASLNSALQRAHAAMRTGAPAPTAPTDDERAVLRSFMDAWESKDVPTLTRMLRDDTRWSMPPAALWFDGRAAIEQLLTLYPIGWQGDFRAVAVGANRQPAAATYLRLHDQPDFRLTSIHVLRIFDGAIAEITTFSASLCRAFELVDPLR